MNKYVTSSFPQCMQAIALGLMWGRIRLKPSKEMHRLIDNADLFETIAELVSCDRLQKIRSLESLLTASPPAEPCT